MALISCPECQKEISDKVKFCPHCGYPLASEFSNDNTPKIALINCPECQKEISDKVKACPHCGYPLEKGNHSNNSITVKNENKKIGGKSSKKKKIIIGSIITLVSLIVILSIIGAIYDVQNEKKNNYFIGLREIHSKILSGGTVAEELTSLTRRVWHNSIYNVSDRDTNKFTIKANRYSSNRVNYNSSDFLSDFNDALSNLAKDNDFNYKKNNLREIQDDVTTLMRNMRTYPKEYEYIYNDLLGFYNTFLSLTDIALYPSGSYNTFTDNVDEINRKYFEYHNKINLYY
jgi:RNA polymerase subunit RPABC4/transcription elongation factor Spt4